MRTIIIMIITAAAAIAVHGQTSTSRITYNGETTTVRTHCFGTSCHSTIVTTNDAQEEQDAADRRRYKVYCQGQREMYGKNLERYPEKISDVMIPCVKDEKLRLKLTRASTVDAEEPDGTKP